MMKAALILFSTLALSGCGITPQGDAVREFLKHQGQKAADQSAQNAKDYLCIYARVGSISKLFQNGYDRQSYMTLCSRVVPLVPSSPPIEEKKI